MVQYFLEYGTTLMEVSSFRYLGLTLPSTDDDWTAVEWNLWRTRVKWGRLANILGREGADKTTLGRLYVSVLHTVILFGSETWVLTLPLEKASRGFTTGKHSGWRAWALNISRTIYGYTHPVERRWQ